MAKKLIISIDGGGIRGVIPLVHLREIQLMLDHDLFYYDIEWWGTSTGAVIAAGLKIQKDHLYIHRIQAVLDLYEFRSESAANPFGSSNPARAFNKLIDYNFADFSTKDFKNLNIVACRTDTAQAHIFNADSDVNLADAVRASCAVPGVFPRVEIDGIEYVDGFVVAKNPAALAMEDQQLGSNTILLSLGCGLLRETDPIEEQVAAIHEEMTKLSEATGFHYYRFDPKLEFAQDHMQNANPKNIFNLKKDAMGYVYHEHYRLKELVSLLDED